MLRPSLLVVVLAAASSMGACTVHNYHSGPPPRQSASGYATTPQPYAQTQAPRAAVVAPRVDSQPLDPYASSVYAQAAPCEQRCDCSRPEARAAYTTVRPGGPVTPGELASANPADLLE